MLQEMMLQEWLVLIDAVTDQRLPVLFAAGNANGSADYHLKFRKQVEFE